MWQTPEVAPPSHTLPAGEQEFKAFLAILESFNSLPQFWVKWLCLGQSKAIVKFRSLLHSYFFMITNFITEGNKLGGSLSWVIQIKLCKFTTNDWPAILCSMVRHVTNFFYLDRMHFVRFSVIKYRFSRLLSSGLCQMLGNLNKWG